MDDETLRLIVDNNEAELQDVVNLEAASTYSARSSDWIIAFKVYAEELELFNAELAQGQTEKGTAQKSAAQEQTFQDLAADQTQDDESHRPGGSQSMERNQVKRNNNTKKRIPVLTKCVACMCKKPQSEMLEAQPCSHFFCTDCLTEYFKRAIADETIYPPRCCKQNIDVNSAASFLEPKLLDRFVLRSVEMNTVDKTYCAQPTCSVFLPSSNIHGNVATCATCSATTCTLCKEPSHEDECKDSPETLVLKELAKAEHWQRCRKCRRMVELSTGCYHMTCRCRHEFCYLCGKRWKTCNCAGWDEVRLVSTANRLVDRDFAEDRWNSRNARVRQARDHALSVLTCNHEGVHQQGIKMEAGIFPCDICGHFMEKYILRCGTCRFQMCERCAWRPERPDQFRRTRRGARA